MESIIISKSPKDNKNHYNSNPHHILLLDKIKNILLQNVCSYTNA